MARSSDDRERARIASLPFDDAAFDAAMGKRKRRRVSRAKKRMRAEQDWDDYSLQVSQGRVSTGSGRVVVVDGEDGSVRYEGSSRQEDDDAPATASASATRTALLAKLAAAQETLEALDSTRPVTRPEPTSRPKAAPQEPRRSSEPARPLVGGAGDTLEDLEALEALISGDGADDAVSITDEAHTEISEMVAEMLDEPDETENETEAIEAPAAYMPKSKTANWCSPMKIKRAVDCVFLDGIDLDPCCFESEAYVMDALARWYGPDFDDIDGLETPWFGDVYMNPPYSIAALTAWSQKAVDELYAGEEEGINVIGLLPAKTDQPWFLDEVLRDSAAVCYVQGRLKFGGSEEGAPFASIVVLWSQDEEMIARFMQAFGVDIRDSEGVLVEPGQKPKKSHRPIGRVVRTAA